MRRARSALPPPRLAVLPTDSSHSTYQQESWKTAVSYHLVHSGVLLLVATLPALPASSKAAGARSFAAAALGSGIALFSGSVSEACKVVRQRMGLAGSLRRLT